MQCQILYNSILPADSEVQDLPQNLPGGHLAAFLFFLSSPSFLPPKLFNSNNFLSIISTMSDQEQAAGKRKRASKYWICF